MDTPRIPHRRYQIPFENAVMANGWKPLLRENYRFEDIYQEALQHHYATCPPLVKMRTLYSKLHNANGRYSQWMSRAINAAIKAGVIKHGDFPNSNKPRYIRTLHVTFAMLLLAYGPNSAYNREYLEKLAKYTGFPAPMTKRARSEEEFAIKLKSLTEEIDSVYQEMDFRFQQQVPIATHIVDFVITVTKAFQTSEVIDKFVIEFDELYHESDRQRRRDRKRDEELTALGYKVIRLGMENAEKWLGTSHMISYPLHLPSAIQKEINSLIITHPRTGKRFVLPINLDVNLEYLETIGAIGSRSKQPLVDIGNFLSQNGVAWTRARLQYQGKEMRVLVIVNQEGS
jgi:very-short-patch-repair endonuclease